MWSKFDDIVDIFLCSLPFELIKSTPGKLKKYSNMQNYLPILSRKLTKTRNKYIKGVPHIWLNLLHNILHSVFDMRSEFGGNLFMLSPWFCLHKSTCQCPPEFAQLPPHAHSLLILVTTSSWFSYKTKNPRVPLKCFSLRSNTLKKKSSHIASCSTNLTLRRERTTVVSSINIT